MLQTLENMYGINDNPLLWYGSEETDEVPIRRTDLSADVDALGFGTNVFLIKAFQTP